MFRRKWSGLPPDPFFPSDLKKLGYFINEGDEVRSIENPNNYFKYFLTRNERYNDRQRFAFNQALEEEIHARLLALGLSKILLPLGTTDPRQPHVPIFASSDMATQKPSRVVLIFGETAQDLGIIAHRVIGGPGGVNKGSMVSVVSALQQQCASATDSRPPGIVLANPGQLIWWLPPQGQRHDNRLNQSKNQNQGQVGDDNDVGDGDGDDGKGKGKDNGVGGGEGDGDNTEDPKPRAMIRTAFQGAPMRSAVHDGALIDERRNRIPENRNVGEHVKYIFETVVPALVPKDAKLDIIAVGDSVDAVEKYFDWGPVWSRWQGRINCFANVGGYYAAWEIKCEGFRRFLRDKARAYTPSLEPLGTILSGPDGNPRTTSFTQLGSPVFSGGADHFTEMLLIQGQSVILGFLQEVALDPDPANYRNPDFHVLYYDIHDDEKDDYDKGWQDWQDVPEDQKPVVEVSVLGNGTGAGAGAKTETAETAPDGGGSDDKIGRVSERVVKVEDNDGNVSIGAGVGDGDEDGANSSNIAEDGSAKSDRSDGKEDYGTKEAVEVTGEPEALSQHPAKKAQ